MRAFGLILLGLSASLVGCGPDCESTCNTLYQEAECNLQSAGYQRSELLLQCNDECEKALQNPGDVRPGYDPYEYTPTSDDQVTFTNDSEVALWMECVAETSCDLMGVNANNEGTPGYCAPVW